ncbi:NADPH:quinone reductase [Virgisporangium aliadipatigenens]|uniref:NADPH:quinone reductase n=1 Tax=Virgisporangium aliadipatigenens TaxID=741659 RepID=A0A8J4DQK5_9ACTN|nr:NADP-dependent oxidoreductase [Virgisporangium aliadipatigenens]GIJ46091.1 NADPH:quinone reductase [Virgisporangium aliadipatigenens]
MNTNDTMKAVTQQAFGGPEVLTVSRVPRPEPLPTEVLVRVRAAGVNPVDWKTRGGGGMAGVLGGPPFTLGWDVAGTVERVGFGVTTLAPGDEVYGMPWFPRAASAYAEYVTAPARHFARKPAKASFEEAAGVPLAALTAWQALVDTAAVGPGQRVLITAAAGGVGHLAVQFAKNLGAHVTAVAGARNQEWLRDLGADEVVDYGAVRVEEAVRDADVAVDLIGDNLEIVRTLRRDGLLIAVPSGVSPQLVAAAERVGVRATPILVEPDGAALRTIAALIDDGAVRVEVAKVFPLEEAGAAHAYGELGHTRGKIVLRVA